MTRAQRRKVERRFHQLACLEALGQITPAEYLKLERYQDLRREWPTAQQKRWTAEKDWGLRCLMKEFGKAEYEAELTADRETLRMISPDLEEHQGLFAEERAALTKGGVRTITEE